MELKSRIVFVMALCLSIASAKDPQWTGGSVISVEHIPSRMMQHNASTNYTVRLEGTEYVLEDGAATYYGGSPKDIFAIGDNVQIVIEGSKHAKVKMPAGKEKRLRIVASRSVAK